MPQLKCKCSANLHESENCEYVLEVSNDDLGTDNILVAIRLSGDENLSGAVELNMDAILTLRNYLISVTSDFPIK